MAHDCTDRQYSQLYSKARQCCDLHGAILIANTALDKYQKLEARGLHLTASRLMECGSRPVSSQVILGASCHALAEVRHANRIGVDYITIGSLFPTPSHPGQGGIGLDQFSRLARSCDVPVYAVGGVKESMLDRIIDAGGFGIAGISEFWNQG